MLKCRFMHCIGSVHKYTHGKKNQANRQWHLNAYSSRTRRPFNTAGGKKRENRKKKKTTFSLQIDSSFLLPFQEKGKSP